MKMEFKKSFPVAVVITAGALTILYYELSHVSEPHLPGHGAPVSEYNFLVAGITSTLFAYPSWLGLSSQNS